MKIKRINKIQDILCFQDYNWDDFFKKGKKFGGNNLIYGDNGNGKSSIVRIMKYLNGDIDSLETNWQLKDTKEQKLKVNGKDSLNKNGSKKKRENNFEIFDEQFIKDNVSDFVGNGKRKTENKKNRGVLLSKAVKGLNEKIEKINDKLNKEKFNNIKSNKNDLLEKINGDFLNCERDDVKKLYEKVKNEKDNSLEDKKIEKLETRIKNIKNIKNKLNITVKDYKIEVDLKNEYRKVFKKTYESIEDVANSNKIKELRTFIKKIVTEIDNNQLDKCLVCGSDIKKQGKYVGSFNKIKEYCLNDEIREIEEQIVKKLDEFEDKIDKIKKLENKYYKLKEKINNDYESILDEKVLGAINNFKLKIDNINEEIFTDIEEKIKKKRNYKAKEIEIKKERNRLKGIEEKIDKFNGLIDNINENLKKLKKEEGKKKEIKKLKKELKKKKNLMNLDEIERIKDKEEEKKELIEKRDNLKEIIKEKFEEEVKVYIEYMDNYLEDISLTLDNKKIEFVNDSRHLKEKPRWDIEIKINGKKIDRGLSEGEKRIIALAYFFAKLSYQEKKEIREEIKSINKKFNESDCEVEKADLGKRKGELKAELKDKVIVYDDPVSDLDCSNKRKLAELISTKFEDMRSQLFVFTHDALFEEYLKQQPKTGYYLFSVCKINPESALLPRDKGYLERYEDDLKEYKDKKIADYKDSTNESNPYSKIGELTHKLRYCIEYLVKDKLLGLSSGTMRKLLDNLDNNERINKLSSNAQKLINIYSFCNKNKCHHYSTRNSAGHVELKKQIGKYLKIVNEF